ncbi:siphovirus ReqiPepy6 Gp37-like family protein [Streptomyces sp. MBT56]|uniref:siphovirus ReqiPepy6 Gp37-like family protein n=1 Tax=unclassified Streptomyces TaxID=2593676 RepID=UPI001909BE71|nr:MULTISPECIES: siphovirus ReqiPepy6 Gp37-like family protein [unclassified Streptomyces]MBK3556307.1 siphovirus ReqiPepy6 Gp37-like family protein [Streptomyces sp. MBT56]MBK3601227.1 siphovirus ReqiPepy6 Gp37-like family protein [Streptomyces sp. MBT54]MBK3614537.1 siphovirus ReqiPepy6 Gp37-like family protein [Streptomyces sp. MBT98]MBK6042818.1 siphovirus ReqiPepy6 Gp37-like family protein [Streptomyces sp. MBT55]
MTIQLLVTDDTLTVQGDPLSGWTNLDATKRFNEPASGTVQLPATPEVMAQLQPGNRLVVIRDGQVWTAGPMEVPADYSWSVDQDPGAGSVTVAFSDDLAVLAGYITWPAPASAWTAQQGNTWRQINTVNSETIIRTLVNENCGPGAIAARRIPNLSLATAAGVGTNTTVRTRFEPLLEVSRRVAIDGGGIGFRTHQTGSGVEFACYAPADLTDVARFSLGLGNLRSLQYKASAPAATHVLVAGSETEGSTTRTFIERSDAAAAAAWWRVERYLDGSSETDADGELTAAGNAEVAESAAPVELATVTVDTADLRAGVDYDLGDRVSVALPHGLEVTDVVRSIHLQATPDSGEYVSAVVGSPAATTDPQLVRLVRTLTRRLGRLEAR